MSPGDPHLRVWDALDRADCRPRGPEHQATARCPAHDDHHPSLRIGIGADGRVLLHCHAGCTAEQIVAALGLKMADLFPAGHHRARRRHLREVRRAAFTGNARTAANVLKATTLAATGSCNCAPTARAAARRPPCSKRPRGP